MIPCNLYKLALILNACHVIGSDKIICSVTIDSRLIEANSIFIALIGRNFDGHSFAKQAVCLGAQALIVNRPLLLNISQIVVINTYYALVKLATWVCHQVKARVVLITGSSGKTTVKNMTTSILKNAGKTVATQKNFNNRIGVPITLLRLTEKDNFAVIELGSSCCGEIRNLIGMLFSDSALINNIFPAHLLGFSSLVKLAQEKGEIFSSLLLNGRAIINADNNNFNIWKRSLTDKLIWKFSLRSNIGADFFATNIICERFGVNFILHCPYGKTKINLSMLGYHNVSNALAASALGLSVGANLSDITYGLEKVKSISGRLNLIVLSNGKFLLDDTYNSNVGSILASIEVLNKMPGYRVLVVSDMSELGCLKEKKYHIFIGKKILKSNIDQVLTIGKLSNLISSVCKNGQHFQKKFDLVVCLKKILSQRDLITILIKGSRNFKMEEIICKLRESL